MSDDEWEALADDDAVVLPTPSSGSGGGGAFDDEDEDAAEELKKPVVPESQPRNAEKAKAKNKYARQDKASEAADLMGVRGAADDEPLDERARHELQLRADLDSASDLFAGAGDDDDDNDAPAAAAAAAAGGSKAKEFVPVTAKDFERYADVQAERITRHNDSRHYAPCIERMVRALVAEHSIDDLKKLEKVLGVLHAEKQKASKAATKNKRAGKKLNIKAELKTEDEFAAGGADDDDDFDFM